VIEFNPGIFLIKGSFAEFTSVIIPEGLESPSSLKTAYPVI
jgi:hypothetical protein